MGTPWLRGGLSVVANEQMNMESGGDRIETILVGSRTLMRESLKALLGGTRILIVGEAQRVNDVVSVVTPDIQPRLVLVDISEFNDQSLEDLRALREALPKVRIVLLTDVLDGQQLSAALAAGIDGYLMKEISLEALLQSLGLVMLGEKVFPTDLATLLINGTTASVKPGRRVVSDEVKERGLSDREMQILVCLAQGDSNKIIANRLDITEATVKVHVKSLLRKIQASNRTQAAIWAVNQGLA